MSTQRPTVRIVRPIDRGNMRFNELDPYKDGILEKLHKLERKIRIVYQTTKDQEKVVTMSKMLSQIDQITKKLLAGNLTWKELEELGIKKSRIVNPSEVPLDQPSSDFQNYHILSHIPIICIINDTNDSLDEDHIINIFYSITEYININYQTIFTQKILLQSSKTNNIREHFYMQHQDTVRIFQSYVHFHNLSSTTKEKEDLLKKEYLQLIKSIYVFLNCIHHYITTVTQDGTFIQEDFQYPIVSSDKSISIYKLPLNLALEECLTFTTEAMAYIQANNKDIFDSISIGQKINK